MTSYYYLDDPESETEETVVPEDEYIRAVFQVAKKHGITITDKEILGELKGKPKKQKSKTHLYIDGTNLFAGQNELLGPKKLLDFHSLLKEIRRLIPYDRIFFYASYIGKVNLDNRKLRRLVESESQFYNQVKSTPGVYFYKGHRSPTSGKEKGVDVHLAVDIVRHAFQKECNQMIIITGDADLTYPLEVAKELGLRVHAVFLPTRFSLAIAYLANTTTVLNYLNKFRYKRGEKKLRKLKIIKIKDPAYKMRGG